MALILGSAALFQVSMLHERWATRTVDALARAISTTIGVLASVIAFGVVTIGWAAHISARVDPLRPPTSPGWARTSHHGPPSRPFGHEDRSPGRGRWRIRLLVVLVLVVSSLGIRWKILNDPAGRSIQYREWAFPGEPWGRDAIREYHASHLERDGALGWHSADQKGRYLNIVDSVRRSWVPPAPELTVWVLGGSAAFGIGQRDDHTISSDLARLLAADGIRVEVVNFGTPGYLAWQEAAQLRIELSRRADPDLVVLYHGYNDLAEVARRAAEGAQPLDAPGNIFERQDRRFRSAPKGAPVTDPDVIAAAAIRILRTQTAAADQAATAADVPLVTVWQPSLWSMSPSAWTPELVDVANMTVDQLRWTHRLESRVVAALGPDLVDLRHSFDDAGRPTFFDAVHTNEAGARIVAEDLYRTIRPQIESLQVEG